MKDWMFVVWNRTPGVLLRTWGTLVLNPFKGNLTPEIKATITDSSKNTDLVVRPAGMTSQLQVPNTVMHKAFRAAVQRVSLERGPCSTPVG
jgi:hypothetical protein